MNINLKLPDGFLDEETRLDYSVSPKMKKTWAIQLDLLNELKKVCDRYGLTYFADSGTLLGAIRHGGYIPWDDDIDIVMKREDYNKLIEVGKQEFQNPYFLQSAHSEFFPRGYARLRNSDSTALTKSDLKVDINHGVFIDIFPLDNLPDDPITRKVWLKKIDLLSRLIRYGAPRRIEAYKEISKKTAIHLGKCIYSMFGYEALVKQYEKLCGKYNGVETKEISYVAYSHGKKKHIWDSRCFDSAQSVPFEFTEIMIPVGYDSRLRTEYQDYMKIVRANTAHGELILEPDIPYKEFMKDHSIHELMEQFI